MYGIQNTVIRLFHCKKIFLCAKKARKLFYEYIYTMYATRLKNSFNSICTKVILHGNFFHNYSYILHKKANYGNTKHTLYSTTKGRGSYSRGRPGIFHPKAVFPSSRIYIHCDQNKTSQVIQVYT